VPEIKLEIKPCAQEDCELYIETEYIISKTEGRKFFYYGPKGPLNVICSYCFRRIQRELFTKEEK